MHKKIKAIEKDEKKVGKGLKKLAKADVKMDKKCDAAMMKAKKKK